MTESAATINSPAGSPLSITGLASGLDTNSIISALMSAQRAPVTRLTGQQEKLQGQQSQLQSLQSSLRQLTFSASEFSLPTLFDNSQKVTSSEPSRVTAATTTGAGVGGYEVEVTQLANSAQRTFSFTSPTGEETITIDGQEFNLSAGASAQELSNEVNSNSSATVYAAVLNTGTIVFSNRQTGNTGSEFIKVTDSGGALSEKTGTAREGKNAEYTVDGVAGISASNTVTEAIPGVTLTLSGLTTISGPVTIDVQPPGPNVTAIESQVQSFIKLYNSTIAEIHQLVTTKPPTNPTTASEFGTGTMFGDTELLSLLNTMRQAMYEPIAGLSAEMSSPANIGISTGAPSGGASSSSSIEGELTLNATQLSEALQANPTGVEKMLQQWSLNLQGTLNTVAEPGGMLETRINGDEAQITNFSRQIETMNEMLIVREKALQATYAQLEGVISQNSAQGTWLASQEASLTASGI